MVYRNILRFTMVLAGIGLMASTLAVCAGQAAPKRGRKYKAPPPTAKIEVTILKDVNGKPIENAAVIFHPMVGEKDAGNMELKTNEDGKLIIDVLPIGDTVRLQVIAPGFRTYGEDYKIEKADMAIEIRMKRPGEQYSVYKMHGIGQVGGKDPDPAPAKDAAPGVAPAPAKSSDAQPSAQPSQAQPKSQ
jgi:hypothetical protein